MKLTNFTDPQKPPKLAKILLRGTIFDQKIVLKIYFKIDMDAKMG